MKEWSPVTVVDMLDIGQAIEGYCSPSIGVVNGSTRNRFSWLSWATPRRPSANFAITSAGGNESPATEGNAEATLLRAESETRELIIFILKQKQFNRDLKKQ